MLFQLLRKKLDHLLCFFNHHKLTKPKIFAKKVWIDNNGQTHEIPMTAIRFCDRQDCDYVERLEIKS